MAFDSWGLLGAAKALVLKEDAPPSHVARSVSTAYYALFQHVCCAAADLLIGGPDTELTRAEAHLMRSIPHRILKKRLGYAQNSDFGFPAELVGFANVFCRLQQERHDADYDIAATFTRGDALDHISDAEAAMRNFDKVEEKHRKAFIVWAILDRPDT